MRNYKGTVQEIQTSTTERICRDFDFIGIVDAENTAKLIDFLCTCEEQDKAIIQENKNKLTSAKTPLEPITINITSFGGSVEYGLAILDKLESMDAPIHTHVNGCAYSMGFILYLAGEVRTAGRFARFMNHGMSTMSYGYLPEIKADYDNCIEQDTICEMYILEKCNYPTRKIEEARNKMHYFGYDDALKWGIITKDIYSKKDDKMSPENINSKKDIEESATYLDVEMSPEEQEEIDILKAKGAIIYYNKDLEFIGYSFNGMDDFFFKSCIDKPNLVCKVSKFAPIETWKYTLESLYTNTTSSECHTEQAEEAMCSEEYSKEENIEKSFLD